MENKLRTLLILMSFMVAGLIFSSCSDDDDIIINEKNPTISIKQTGTLYDSSVDVVFTPNELTSYYDYAISTRNDLSAFENGSFETKREDASEAKTVTFDGLEGGNIYYIYARPYDNANKAGSTAILAVRTFFGGFELTTQYVTDQTAAFRIDIDEDYWMFRYAILEGDGDLAAFEAEVDEPDEENGLGIVTEYERTGYYVITKLDLKPETEYTFYFKAYHRSGIESPVYHQTINTVATAQAPSFQMDVQYQDYYYGTYRFTPDSDTDRMIVAISAKGWAQSVVDGNFNWKGDYVTMFSSWALAGEQIIEAIAGQGTGPVNLSFNHGSGEYYDTELEIWGVYFKDGEVTGMSVQDYAPVAVGTDGAPVTTASVTRYHLNWYGKVVPYLTFSPNEYVAGFVYEIADVAWMNGYTEPGADPYYDGFFDDYFQDVLDGLIPGKYVHNRPSVTGKEYLYPFEWQDNLVEDTDYCIVTRSLDYRMQWGDVEFIYFKTPDDYNL